MNTFLIILAAIGIIVLMFFIFKWINSRKIKSLEKTVESLVDQNTALDNRNTGLEEKMDQMSRERAASGNHMSRLVRTQEETGNLYRKIDKAHSDEEIMALMDYIDNDNNKIIHKD